MDVRRRIIRWKPAIRHSRNRIGEASVPEKVIFRVMDQEAVVRDVDWLSDIYANRPSRLVGRVSLTAVEHIHPVYAFPIRLGPVSATQEKHRNGGYNHADFLHGTTSKFQREAGFGSTHFSLCAYRMRKTQTKTAQAEACATGLRRTQFLQALLTNFYLSGPPGHAVLPPLQSPATCSGSPFPATSTLIPAGSRMDQPYLLSASGL